MVSAYNSAYSENSIAIGIARAGADNQKIVCGTLKELLDVDFGEPLHSLVLPGKIQYLEAEVLREFVLDNNSFDQFAEIIN
jgi:diphthine synthase